MLCDLVAASMVDTLLATGRRRHMASLQRAVGCLCVGLHGKDAWPWMPCGDVPCPLGILIVHCTWHVGLVLNTAVTVALQRPVAIPN